MFSKVKYMYVVKEERGMLKVGLHGVVKEERGMLRVGLHGLLPHSLTPHFNLLSHSTPYEG